MDSARLIINNNDLSTGATIERTTTVSGFTVVKAPKGPKTPIRIPANSTAKLQDIFGVPDQEYPDLYEAYTFNSSYDTYISAPYGDSEVYVAYVLDQGVFASADPITYDEDIEQLVFGEKEVDEVKESLTAVAEEDSDSNAQSRIFVNIADSHLFGDDILPQGSKLTYSPISVDNSGNLTFSTSEMPENIDDKDKESTGEDKYPSSAKLRLYDDATGHYYDFTVKANSTYNGYYLIDKDGTPVGYVKWEVKKNPEGGDDISQVKYTIEGSSEDGVKLNTTVVANLASHIESLRVGYLYDMRKISEGGSTSSGGGTSTVNEEVSTEDGEGQTPGTSTPGTEKIPDLKDNIHIHAVIFPKYPSARRINIDFTPYSVTRGTYKSTTAVGRNILKMSVSEEKAFHDSSKPLLITGSLDNSYQDATGAFINFNELNASYVQDLIHVAVLEKFSGSSYDSISRLPSVVIPGGVRGECSYEDGWEEALDDEYATVDVFFQSGLKSLGAKNPTESVDDIAATGSFFKIADTHTLAGCIFNETVDPSKLGKENDSNITITELTYGPNYWNICNLAVVELARTGQRFTSTLTGARALMQARIINSKYGGAAPMYINSGSPAMGGQLAPLAGSSFVRLKYKYSKEQQMKLDELNYNPVIGDRTYGVMVVGQKTCKSGDITDWSYIGHVSAFLNFQKEVRNNVMIPQLGKANNPYYRDLRKQQVENILSKRLSGSNRIWTSAIVDTSTADGVNDAAARRARKFIIDVKVKVDVFSEYVTLNFTNVDQGTDL